MKPDVVYHLSRSWSGPGWLETSEECTCEKAPCGMVLSNGWEWAKGQGCPHHDFTRTIRSSHTADNCPALKAYPVQ